MAGPITALRFGRSAAGTACRHNPDRPRRRFWRRDWDCARTQADYYGGAETGDWASDSVQDDQGIPDAVWVERCERAAQHGGVRKACGGIVSGGVDSGGERGG